METNSRFISDDILRAMYWARKLALAMKDGVVIQNRVLQCLLRTNRVHKGRAHAFACRIAHQFPFSKIETDPVNNGNRLVLGLGPQAPRNPMGVWEVPNLNEIAKELGVNR